MKSKGMFALVLSLFTLQAQGFTLLGGNGNLQGFSAKELKFYLNPTSCPSNVESLVKEAMEAWNSVSTSGLTMKLAGHTTTLASDLGTFAFPETAVIACSTDFANDSGLSASAAGAGSASTLGSGSKLQKGFLILNVEPGTPGDLSAAGVPESTQLIAVAHELGHSIGLGHSEAAAALMHFSVASKKELNLHQDDADGISYLYPRDELSGDQPLGCGSVSLNSTKPGSLSLTWLFLAFLFIPFILLVTARRRVLF